MVSPRIATGILVTVTAVWVVSFVLSIVLPSFRPDPQINLIFMALVGGSLTLKRRAETEEPPP
jgi:hypothetical protein